MKFRVLMTSTLREDESVSQNAFQHTILSTLRTRMELQFHPGPARKLSTNLYDIYHCWVYSE